MMSDRDLSQRLALAREFEHEIGGKTFRLRLPTRSELRVTLLKHGLDFASAGAVAASNLAVVREALLWGRGITTADIGLPGDPEPLPETPAGAWAYVAEHTEVLDELRDVLMERAEARFDSIEADVKN